MKRMVLLKAPAELMSETITMIFNFKLQRLFAERPAQQCGGTEKDRYSHGGRTIDVLMRR